MVIEIITYTPLLQHWKIEKENTGDDHYRRASAYRGSLWYDDDKR